MTGTVHDWFGRSKAAGGGISENEKLHWMLRDGKVEIRTVRDQFSSGESCF